MILSLPSPPHLGTHSWRPLRLDDVPALFHLEVDCAFVDGGTSIASMADWRAKLELAGNRLTTDSLGLADSTGRLAAVALVACDQRSVHEYRFFLDGRIHPDYRGRGLGSFVLHWMETRAREILSGLKEDRPAVLRIEFHDRGEDALALFKEQGFSFAFAEDEMRRDLSLPIPAVRLPSGLSLATWSAQRASLFFQVYQDAFRERPGFPHWSEAVWRQNFTGGASFRPDLSLLLSEGVEPVGFAICHEVAEGGQEAGDTGRIVQIGMRPTWRRRGLGSALLNDVMRRFQAEGRRWAALEVNIDNDRALRLYQRLGFERVRRRTIYQKTASSSPSGDRERA